MILKCTSFEQMNKEIIDGNMSIVIFGAGVIGTVTVPEVLAQYDLLNRVVFYVDNYCGEQGKTITIRNKTMKIESAGKLNDMGGNTAIILAVSRYVGVLKQLEGMPCSQNMICYIMPMMCIHNFCSGISKGKPILTQKPIIPKKIHYMWLGKNPIPDNLRKCIDSWKKYCPDYEIIRWDENNYDIKKHEYMRVAYETGNYSFVSDYARLDILYQCGGIYMDTDVEVIKNLDSLLYQEAFCGLEKWQIINTGGCCGAVKGQLMIGEFLKTRENVFFIDKNGKKNMLTCGFYDTNTALKNGYQLNGTTQNVRGMNIYAYDYFHPYDYMSGQTVITRNTYTIHRFNGGWLNEKMRKDNMNAANEYDRIYQECIKNQ